MSYKLNASGDLVQSQSNGVGQSNGVRAFQMSPSGDLLAVSANQGGSRRASNNGGRASSGGGYGLRGGSGSGGYGPCGSGGNAVGSSQGQGDGACPPPGQAQLRKEWEDQRREIVVLKNQLKQTEDVVRCELQIQERNLQNLQCQWAQEKQALVEERNGLKKELCCLMEGTKKKLQQMEETHKCEHARLESQMARDKRSLQEEGEYYKNELRCLYQRMANVLNQTQIQEEDPCATKCN